MELLARTIGVRGPSFAALRAIKWDHDNLPTRHGDPFRMQIPTKLEFKVLNRFTTICVADKRRVLDGPGR